MAKLLRKEMKLSASPLSYFFILFGLMFFVPGYPILCGAFFSCLGLFKSFEWAREANDVVFSALLPIAKRDIVKGRYAFVCLVELCTLLLMAVGTAVRMTFLSDAAVYRTNVMMNANLFALGAAFVIFGLFNLIFVGGFFKTAYKLGRPFLLFILTAFLCIGLFEALHHLPGLGWLNAFGADCLGAQALLLLGGMAVWLLFTLLSCRRAIVRFEMLDL